MDADVIIRDEGSIVLVTPISEPAVEWLAEHTDGQWWGAALVVEHRYADGLIARMQDAGFNVEAA